MSETPNYRENVNSRRFGRLELPPTRKDGFSVFKRFAFPVRRALKAYNVMDVSDHTYEIDAHHSRRCPFGSADQPLPHLYIAEYDRKRKLLVDRRFRTLSTEIAGPVFQYRTHDLTDLAQVANLAEEAIYKANCVLSGRPCANPAGYVLTIFRRDVDQYLRRLARTASYDQGFGGCSDVAASVCTAQHVERSVLVREALENMDRLTRWICVRRFVHDEGPEAIGRALGLSSNSVSIRLSRGLSRVRDVFGATLKSR